MSKYTGTDLEYYRKTWNGIKDTFEKLGLKPYQPFKYCNKLCYLDARPVLIVYDFMFGDWIAPAYEHMQVDYILKNNENIEPLDFEENCDKLETSTISSYRDWEIALKALELEAKANKYDEITKQLGCHIEVVMKALKGHINATKEICYTGDVVARCLIFDGHNWQIMTSGFNDVFTKDYKKTWFLKENMSE